METTGFHIADNLEEEESIVSSNENLCKLQFIFITWLVTYYGGLGNGDERLQNYDESFILSDS